MFYGLWAVGGGAGSFQLFKRFMLARNDDLRQGKVPVLKPRCLQFDAEPSGDFGLAQAHLLDFPPVELQPFQAVVQFQNKVNMFVPLMTVRGEHIRISVFRKRPHIFGRKRFQILRRHTAPVRERHDKMNGAPPVFAPAFRFFGQSFFELLRRQTRFRFVPGAFAFANPAAMNLRATPDGLSNLSSIALCSGGNRKAIFTFAIPLTPVPKSNERARKAAPPPKRPSPRHRKRLAFCRTCGTSDRRRSSRISPTSPASGSIPFPSDKRKLPCVLNTFS